MSERILGIIPARGGSKGVPRKNIRPLAGKSLIQRAFECAQETGALDRIILSTDDAEAAEIAEKIGLEVPFMRPAELAGDQVAMIDVVIHALDALEAAGYRPDAVMLLQPTTPSRTPAHIRDAIALLPGFDSVCSVMELPKTYCPHHVMRISDEGSLQYFLPDGAQYTRRQDVPPAFVRDGTIYLTHTEVLCAQRSFYGARCRPLVSPWGSSINIDTEEDWQAAERYLAARQSEDFCAK